MGFEELQDCFWLIYFTFLFLFFSYVVFHSFLFDCHQKKRHTSRALIIERLCEMCDTFCWRVVWRRFDDPQNLMWYICTKGLVRWHQVGCRPRICYPTLRGKLLSASKLLQALNLSTHPTHGSAHSSIIIIITTPRYWPHSCTNTLAPVTHYREIMRDVWHPHLLTD